MNQESCARHPLTSLQVAYTWRVNNGKVATAFCLCPNEAVITSPSKSNCLVLERKKVLNYTHPWRHAINVAADFLAIVLYNKCVYVGNLQETVGLQWVPGPYTQEQCCQRQHIDHHI